MKRYLGRKKVMKIYLDNTDIYEGEPLWQKILESVREKGLAGATVFKAVAGMGVHTDIHTSGVWVLSQKLPVVVEIIDDEEKILDFLQECTDMIGEGMVTMSDVDVIRYKKSSGNTL
jgi:PII-like signaling protein